MHENQADTDEEARIQEEVEDAPPTNFTMSEKLVSCCVDFSPLVNDEDRSNYVRLRYNEYLLHFSNDQVDLDSNLERRREQVENGEHEIRRLNDEIERAEAERRSSEHQLATEADGHRQREAELESDVAALRAEIAQLKDPSGVGADARHQIIKEVDGALFELEQLENDVGLRQQKLQELESEALKKDEQLIKTRNELENIKMILHAEDKKSEDKICQLKDSIASKERELNDYRLEIEALKACKAELQKEAEQLKENVCEKDVIIDSYKSDNQKISDELEDLRQRLHQYDSQSVAEKELSTVEENTAGERLAALEDQVQQRRQQNNSAYQAMEQKIQQALDALDFSEDRVKNLVAHAHSIEMTHNQMVEQALLEIYDEQERRVSQGSAHPSLTDEKASERFKHFEQERLLSTLDGLDAVDRTLSQAEELAQSRSTSVDVEMRDSDEKEDKEESFFVRYYALFLTGLFLVLVVGGNFMLNEGGWSIWMPYFVLAALSFALPHPYGAVATLLAALVVAASSFV